MLYSLQPNRILRNLHQSSILKSSDFGQMHKVVTIYRHVCLKKGIINYISFIIAREYYNSLRSKTTVNYLRTILPFPIVITQPFLQFHIPHCISPRQVLFLTPVNNLISMGDSLSHKNISCKLSLYSSMYILQAKYSGQKHNVFFHVFSGN